MVKLLTTDIYKIYSNGFLKDVSYLESIAYENLGKIITRLSVQFVVGQCGYFLDA